MQFPDEDGLDAVPVVVYVFEGDAPFAEEFPRFFRVRRERYLAAWALLIDAHNPILPLDVS